MKLTKYGFHLNLLGFSSFLSVLGIIVSLIGAIGGLACIIGASQFAKMLDEDEDVDVDDKLLVLVVIGTFYFIGVVILLFMIPYLIMWTLLKIKTSKKNFPGIEKIGKVYSYAYGGLEIIVAIALILIAIENPVDEMTGKTIGYIIVSAIYLIFTCLKIHGIRVENNKLLGTWLGFRYIFFFLYMITIIVYCIKNDEVVVYIMIAAIIYFILDIGLTLILHSIRVCKENSAETVQFENMNTE